MIKYTLTYFYLISLAIFSQAFAADVSPFQVVYDDKITNGEKENHLVALIAFKKAWKKTDSKMTYHFYDLDNGYVTAFSNVDAADYNSILDKRWADHRDQFDSEFLAENGKVYARSIEWQNHYAQQYDQDLSVAGDIDIHDYPYIVWMKLNLNGLQSSETIQALKDLAKLDRKIAAPLHYRTYRILAGDQLPKLNIFYFAKSEAKFEEAMDKVRKARGDDLENKIEAGLINKERITGQFLPDISY